MTLYFSYLLNVDHQLYFGKWSSWNSRFGKHLSNLNLQTHHNSGILEFFQLCYFNHVTDANNIIKSKIFFGKIVKFEINKRNSIEENYEKTNQMVSRI